MQNKTIKQYVGLFIFSVLLIGVYKTWNTEFISKLLGLLSPLFIGIILAYILCKPSAKLETLIKKIPLKIIKKFSRVISILLVYFITALLLYWGLVLLIPMLFKNIASIVTQLPSAIDQIIAFVESHEFMGYSINIENAVAEMANSISIETILNYLSVESIMEYVKEIFNISSAFVTAFIGIIISVYLILERDKYFELGNRLLSCIFRPEIKNEIHGYLHKVNEFIGRYLYCRLLDATIMFFISLVALLILDIRYAVVLATVVAVCNIVPYIGSIISTIILIVVTLFSEGSQRAIVVGIVMLILQQIDGNVLAPFIVKDKLKISPVVVIVAVIVGGGFGGIIGIMLGVPIAAVIKLIGSDLLHHREVVLKYREKHGENAKINYFGSSNMK